MFYLSLILVRALMGICVGCPPEDTMLPYPITWLPSLHTCVVPRVHVCAPTQMCVSTCLPSQDWFCCRWGILIGGWRITPSQSEWLCVSVLLRFTQHRMRQVHACVWAWSSCVQLWVWKDGDSRWTAVREYKYADFDLRQSAKNLGSRLEGHSHVSVNNSQNNRRARCSTCVNCA